MTDDEFFALVKGMSDKSRTDGYIGSTWFIAMKAGMTTPAARRQMIRLEKAGRVARIEKWSGSNNITWKLA